MNDIKMKEEPVRSNPLMLIVFIILLVSIGAGGMYVYFQVTDGTECIEETKAPDEIEPVKTSISPDSYLVSDLLSQYDKIFTCFDINEMYLADKYNISDMSEEDKMILAIDKADDTFVSESEFEKHYKILFGFDANVNNEDISLDGNLYYTYDDGYIYNDQFIWGCVGGNNFVRKAYATEFDGDNLVVYASVGLLLFNAADPVIIQFDEDAVNSLDDDTNITDEKYIISSYDDFDIDEDYKDLTSYKYYFNYDNDEGIYSLEYVEKMDEFKN